MTTTLSDALSTERGHHFFPADEVMAQIPALYATDSVSTASKVMHLHFFVKDCDWWVAEYDPATGRAFGFVQLGGDTQNSEWGYIDLVELGSLFQQGSIQVDTTTKRPVRILPRLIVERDLGWTPVPASQVPAIKTWGE